jgi:hypothetical protein
VSLIRNRGVIGIAAALIGAGAALGIERATHWSPVGHLGSVSATAVCNALRHPAGTNVEICVEPGSTSAADDFLRSVLAAFVGGALGVGTFIAGQISVSGRERRTGQVAVTVVRTELQANRAAMNRALLPAPPSTTPIPERITLSTFVQVRMQLADCLPYKLLVRTFLLYEQLGDELEDRNLRDVAPQTVERLYDETEALDEDLKVHGLDSRRKEL